MRSGASKLRLAGLYENKLSELPKAIDSYEEVIGRDEKSEAALGALERLLADLPERETLRYRSRASWTRCTVGPMRGRSCLCCSKFSYFRRRKLRRVDISAQKWPPFKSRVAKIRRRRSSAVAGVARRSWRG